MPTVVIERAQIGARGRLVARPEHPAGVLFRTRGMPSGPEWFIVLAVVLLIFGGSQLPKLARNLGQAQKEFKHGLAETQSDD